MTRSYLALVGFALFSLVVALAGPPRVTSAQTPPVINADEDRSEDISEGDTLSYQITATNTGEVQLTNVIVSDVLSGDRQSCATLAPAGKCVLTATYTVRRADVVAGQVSTSANARADQVASTPLTAPARLVLPAPTLLVGIASPVNADEDGSGDLSAGDTLTYTISATSAGTANLTNVTVSGSQSPCAMLRPGATCTAAGTHTVSAGEASAGFVNLVGSASSAQTGNVQTISRMALPEKPSIQVIRTGTLEFGADGTASPGDTIRLQFSIVNTGNVTLQNVIVNDPGAGVVDCLIGSLAPGAVDQGTCTGTYRLTQADIDAGTPAGRALAVGEAATQIVTAESEANPAGLAIPRNPALTVDRTVGANEDQDGSDGVSEGDSLTFEVTAINAGNVTLTNVKVGDRLTGDETGCSRLAPTASCRLTFPYGVKESDITAGIANLAYATSDQTGDVRPRQLISEVAGVRMPATFLGGVSGLSGVSTDVKVVGTNLTLALAALATLLVATTVFNSTLEENAAGIEAIIGRISHSAQLAPFVAALSWLAADESAGANRLLNVIKAAVLVVVTAAIYALLEPDFGFNEQTALVVSALVAGIAVATFLFEGGQVLWASARYDTPGAMRVYPVAILIALICVGFTRVTNLHPGVIFGFVTAAVVFPRREMTDDMKGKMVALPLAALLLTSFVAFLLVDPLRSFNAEHAGVWSALPETVAVAVFVGGAQSALLILIPVSFNDGEKVWAWNKLVWLALAIPAAFAFFHVLLNEEDYGELVKDTDTVTLLAVCAAVVTVSIGTWLYFRLRHRPAEVVEATPEPPSPSSQT